MSLAHEAERARDRLDGPEPSDYLSVEARLQRGVRAALGKRNSIHEDAAIPGTPKDETQEEVRKVLVF